MPGSIAIEASCLTGGSRRRGVGLYSGSLVRSLEDSLDATLVVQGPILGDPPSRRLPIFTYPGVPLWGSDADAAESACRFEEALERSAARLVHYLWAFEDRRLPLETRSVPRVATVYDLIPLILPAHYLDPLEPAIRAEMLRRYDVLAGMDHLIAISETTRRDLVERLDVAADRISVAPPDAHPAFRPRPPTDPERTERLVPGPFALYAAGIDPRKNLLRLLEAFAVSETRRTHRLAIACEIEPEERSRLDAEAERLGVGERVILLGHVPLETLVDLYNAASFSIFPSLYEGFGLPILEALRCGCPVVASETSSLPEVAGSAAVFVDPFDPASIARGIDLTASDPELRHRLREAGLERASRFSWADSANVVARVYERVGAARTRRRGLLGEIWDRVFGPRSRVERVDRGE